MRYFAAVLLFCAGAFSGVAAYAAKPAAPAPVDSCPVVIAVQPNSMTENRMHGNYSVSEDTLANDLRGGCKEAGPVSAIKVVLGSGVTPQRRRVVELIILQNAPASAPITYVKRAN